MCAAHCYGTRSDYRRWSGLCRCYVASEMLDNIFSSYFNRRFLRTSELPSGKTHSRKKEKHFWSSMWVLRNVKKRNKLIHIKQGCTNKQRIMETSKSRQSRWGFFTAIYCIRNKPDFRIRTQSREGKKPCNVLTKERICNLTERLQKQQGFSVKNIMHVIQTLALRWRDILCVLAEHADLEVIELKWCSWSRAPWDPKA